MPSTTQQRTDRGGVEAGGAGGLHRRAIVGCPVPDGPDLLPPPRPRDRRLLLLLRAPDLPRLHDPDPGRDALPGVHPPADQGGRRGPGRRRRGQFGAYPATIVLIAINVVVYLVEIASGWAASAAASTRQLTSSIDFGGALRARRWREGGGQWYRLVTGGFLHASFIHIVFNMAALYFLGRLLEPAHRHARASSSSTSPRCWRARSALCCCDPHTLTVGASGAIFGIFGGDLRDRPRARARRDRRSDRDSSSCSTSCSASPSPAISIGAHLGGLVGGSHLRRRDRRRGAGHARAQPPCRPSSRRWRSSPWSRSLGALAVA